MLFGGSFLAIKINFLAIGASLIFFIENFEKVSNSQNSLREL